MQMFCHIKRSIQMRVSGTQIHIRRSLFSSIAGISVILTAVKSFQYFQQQLNCQARAFMSTSKTVSNLGLLLADFDQTCNTRDTSELYYRASQKYRNSSEADKLVLDNQWQQVTGKYLREYREQISKSLSRFKQNQSIHFDEDGLHSFLKEIAKFNEEATKDVDNSKLIIGVDKIGLQWAATQVKFYPGCFDTIKSIIPFFRIVSVNWSVEMIGYAFNNMIPDKHIHANHLLDANGISSGLIGKEMISSFDKKQVVQEIMLEMDNKGVVIFVGDSITDLLSMLEVDIGIIIGDSKTVLETAKIFGITIAPLKQLLNKKALELNFHHGLNKQRILYFADDWFQINELVQKFST